MKHSLISANVIVWELSSRKVQPLSGNLEAIESEEESVLTLPETAARLRDDCIPQNQRNYGLSIK